LSISSTISLNNGVKMPMLGLGTYQSSSQDVKPSILHALKEGYTHIDTASVYRNEEAVGEVIQGTRDQLFITTKLGPSEQGYDGALKACHDSLTRLGTDYLDLYLIHWPGTSRYAQNSPKHGELRRESWLALEKLYKDGKCKAIGVSNYTSQHLEEMKSYATIIPAVNQVELHPWLTQVELRQTCDNMGIVVESYATLGQGQLLREPTVVKIASRYNKTPAQVLLRWGLQHNLVIIPKSVTPQRISENALLYDFELTSSDMNELDNMNRSKRICWDPTTVQ